MVGKIKHTANEYQVVALAPSTNPGRLPLHFAYLLGKAFSLFILFIDELKKQNFKEYSLCNIQKKASEKKKKKKSKMLFLPKVTLNMELYNYTCFHGHVSYICLWPSKRRTKLGLSPTIEGKNFLKVRTFVQFLIHSSFQQLKY